MNKIKFRVWHPDEYNMYYFDNFEAMGTWCNHDGYRSINQIGMSVDWMQYTCLNDKKNNDAYFGDIILIFDIPYLVFWHIDQIRLAPRGNLQFDKTLDGFKINWGEIIGNIYQNPELLKEK